MTNRHLIDLNSMSQAELSELLNLAEMCIRDRFPAKPEEAVRLMEKRFHQPRKEKPAE